MARVSFALLCCAFLAMAMRPTVAHADDDRERTLVRAHRAITPLYERRTPPLPGEWLASNREDGQTFEQFRVASEYRNFSRATIYVQPLGAFTPEQTRLLADIETALALFYGKPIKRLDTVATGGFPQRTNLATGQPQLSTPPILGWLAARKPADAQAVLAFTATDLYPGNDWNYVFGQASLDRPVGVWSIARMGDPKTDYTTTLRRALKLALHETGHMFGIKHCTAYRCGMSGTNSLQETDRAPMAFCPECEHKVWWALRLDLAARYTALIAYAKAHDLTIEAQFWSRIQRRLR